MIEIESLPYDQGIFCPSCGTATVDWDSEYPERTKINDCPHLQFLGSDDGAETDKNELYNKFEKSKDFPAGFFHFLEKTLSDDYVCFSQCVPPPGGTCGFTIYKFEGQLGNAE